MVYFFPHYKVLMTLIAGFICWFIHPFIVMIFGRWQIITEDTNILKSSKIWATAGSSAWWVFAVAASFAIISFGLYYRKLLMDLSEFASRDNAGVLDDFMFGLKTNILAGFAAAIAAFIVVIIAHVMKNR